MKKILISLIIVFAAFAAQAQYLSPFGIGTNNPNGTLHLHSSTVIQNSVVPTDGPGGDDPDIDPDPDPHYETILHVTNTATGSTVGDGFLIWQYDKNVTFMQKETGSIEIKTTGGNIKLASNGYVGIGSLSSGHKLNVDGSVRFGGNVKATGSLNVDQSATISQQLIVGSGFQCDATGNLKVKHLKVTLTDWADYVFAEDYRLMSLGELEEYIGKNGHLPEVPSIAEVEKNGVDLGEMNRLLLQKVEELTLYIIDLQKQVDEIKKDIK